MALDWAHTCEDPRKPEHATRVPSDAIVYLGTRVITLHAPGIPMATTMAPAEPRSGPAAPIWCASTAETGTLISIMATWVTAWNRKPSRSVRCMPIGYQEA